MRGPVLVFLLLALSLPAMAAEEGQGQAVHGKPPEAGAPGTNIDMPFLMAPMTGADGKLSGYAYVTSRVTATSDANAGLVRDKLAFIQDAFVRDVNAREIAKTGDPVKVDEPALQVRLLADARKVMGPGKVAAVAIVQVQIAPLRPGPVTAVAGRLPPADPLPATEAPAAGAP